MVSRLIACLICRTTLLYTKYFGLLQHELSQLCHSQARQCRETRPPLEDSGTRPDDLSQAGAWLVAGRPFATKRLLPAHSAELTSPMCAYEFMRWLSLVFLVHFIIQCTALRCKQSRRRVKDGPVYSTILAWKHARAAAWVSK